MSAEVKATLEAKYSPEKEREARAFIENRLGKSIPGRFAEGLRDGILLCEFANKLKPGTIKKIETSKMSFKMMENIGNFCTALHDVFGVPVADCFMTVDLFEEKNMTQVVQSILALKRKLETGK